MIKLIWTLYPFVCSIVIDGIYEALQNFGFEGGNVLEPSCGVGNFFGRMPDEMQDNSQLYGVEIDSISGRIAQILYPDADIEIQGFEKNSFQNGSFDVAVGNVPFGELGFKDTVHGAAKLHDFFFAESLDNVSIKFGQYSILQSNKIAFEYQSVNFLNGPACSARALFLFFSGLSISL